jgi:hypothetical protein
MGPTDSPETSVSGCLTPHSNPENGIIQFNCGGSLRSRIVKPACNRTATDRILSVADRFSLIQILSFKLKIIGAVKVLRLNEIPFYPGSA